MQFLEIANNERFGIIALSKNFLIMPNMFHVGRFLFFIFLKVKKLNIKDEKW